MTVKRLRAIIKETIIKELFDGENRGGFEFFTVEIINADREFTEFDTLAEAEEFFNDDSHGMGEFLWEEGYETEAILRGVKGGGLVEIVLASRMITKVDSEGELYVVNTRPGG